MQASELNKIFIEELRDIYSAETQLVSAACACSN
jgi:ferritin-like metal-binding protein YciE